MFLGGETGLWREGILPSLRAARRVFRKQGTR